ncbi:hypothetical protein AWJ20_871 [Sugiyamaella lignohabitans]|uniref:DUF7729 domain-containing protein n=1 Tax=Sugiyamaella lignohabitans TaxID=796027 RepID=A0A167D8J1_9ASCO|nr:uncharacterized protein AWJ20_871 [Sugiyamaella lignohabitans]ANB12612.1 hypothetical protein AWJ20_871 [Sugiyamaella lignohabitans]
MSEVFTTASTTAVVTVGSSFPSSTTLPLASATPSQFVYPTTFDTSLGTNFTNSSCPEFFKSFLYNEDFINCYPMSFFLLNSKSYVTIVRQGISSVETVLNASCSVDYQQCSSLMSNYSNQLIQADNCLNDYNLENPLVTQAYNDFVAYDVIHDVMCLRRGLNHSNATQLDRDTKYCYSHGLFDADSSTGDAYLYLLPLGIPYPNMTAPSCSRCTKRVMDIFWEFTGVVQNQISYTYNSAAGRIAHRSNCSANFINASAKALPSPSATKSHSAAATVSPSLMLILLLFPFVMSILMLN